MPRYVVNAQPNHGFFAGDLSAVFLDPLYPFYIAIKQSWHECSIALTEEPLERITIYATIKTHDWLIPDHTDAIDQGKT